MNHELIEAINTLNRQLDDSAFAEGLRFRASFDDYSEAISFGDILLYHSENDSLCYKVDAPEDSIALYHEAEYSLAEYCQKKLREHIETLKRIYDRSFSDGIE